MKGEMAPAHSLNSTDYDVAGKASLNGCHINKSGFIASQLG